MDLSFLLVGLLLFFRILNILIFARVILSWFMPDFQHPVGRMVYQLTEPVLRPIRDRLPNGGFIDWSPWLAIILFDVLRYALLAMF